MRPGVVVEVGGVHRYTLIDRAAPSGWWAKLTHQRPNNAPKTAWEACDDRPQFERLLPPAQGQPWRVAG